MRALDRRPVGERIRVRDAELDGVGAGRGQGPQGPFGGVEVGVSGHYEGDEGASDEKLVELGLGGRDEMRMRNEKNKRSVGKKKKKVGGRRGG